MKYSGYDKLRKGLSKLSSKISDDFESTDSFDMSVENDTIILKKCVPECFLCNSTENVITFKGKKVCKNCIQRLKGQ